MLYIFNHQLIILQNTLDLDFYKNKFMTKKLVAI